MKDSLAGRVLLAEDCRDNQLLIASLLRKWGLTVAVADDGREAVAAALASREAGEPFDVILMDMQMPVVDGYAATQELRGRGWAGPIIALTANAMVSDRKTCLDAGCSDYATKPIIRQTLYALLVEALPRRAAEHRAPAPDATPPPPEPDAAESESAYSPRIALDRAGGDVELCAEILTLVLREGELWLGQIREFLAAGNFRQARRIAHSAKNAADNIGAARVREAFLAVEQAAAAGDAAATRAATAAAEQPLDELLTALRERK